MAGKIRWVTTSQHIVRRNSVRHRTGPVATRRAVLQVWAGSRQAFFPDLPRVTPEQITMGSDNSWIPSAPLAASRQYGPEEVGEVTRDVVATLIRELGN